MLVAPRRTVVLAPGALYLFWTTGVFYVFELARDYDLILLVPEDYRQSEEFLRLIAEFPGIQIHYVPAVRPVRRLHHFYAGEVRRIITAARPRFVLSNDIWGMEMLYLFHFARLLETAGHPCGRIAIQTSNWLNNVRQDLDEGRDAHAQYYRRAYHLPRVLASWLVHALMHAFRVLNVFLYPALYAGAPLRPWRTLLPATSQADAVGKFDAFLYYTEAEGDVVREMLGPACPLQKVEHPVRAHEAAARALLRADPEAHAIVILPSYVSVLMLQRDLGLEEQAAIDYLADRWALIVTELGRRFPHYPVRWKIHPQMAGDRHWRAVTERLLALAPVVEVRHASEKAEKLIFEHSVVAGDISTTLMWAALFRSKTVISFDVFGTKYREMATRENIWYVDDLPTFESALDPSKAAAAAPSGRQTAPRVREYLSRLAG